VLAIFTLLMILLGCFATCAGSTGGGIKMVRMLLLLKQARRELTRIVHPHAVSPVVLGGRAVGDRVMQSVIACVMVYGASLAMLTMVLLFSGLDVVSAFTAVVACVNNIGPGLCEVGPAVNYQGLSDFQAWACTLAMLLGRLELLAVLALFTPRFWCKRGRKCTRTVRGARIRPGPAAPRPKRAHATRPRRGQARDRGARLSARPIAGRCAPYTVAHRCLRRMSRMRQLSAHDASFLFSDTTHSNANVTLIHIYNQSTAPGGKVRFKSILAQIESRLGRLPIFRQKLVRVPLGLDYPYWADDENFDLEYHVRHIALPKPGDWRQFCISVSRIHARPLDLSRPLWEIHVIEGLDGFLDLPQGSFALLTKTHHAAIDVENGSEITMLLHDLEPTPPADGPPAPWFPERPPRAIPMMARGVAHSIKAPFKAAGPLGRAIGHALPTAMALMSDLLLHPHHMPATRFNAIVSPHRVFETRRFTLDEFKSIRALVKGATVNDAVLAVCGGGLRRYLQLHGELPAGSLSVMAPFYVRGQGTAARADTGAGTAAPGELSWTRVQLGTDLEDPVERLAAIRAQTGSSEVVARAVGARELTEAGHQVPAATLALTGKLLGRAMTGIGRRSPLASCTITNVPGPSVPLYLCGARMTYFSAMMPISDGMGLVFAVTSYDGRIVISPTSCRELMPDPAVFAQCVRDSFQEYLAIAATAPRPRPDSARPPATQRGATLRGRLVRSARRRASPAGMPRPTTHPG
jgi:WS/DGAT/MGAT family acyltransferase